MTKQEIMLNEYKNRIEVVDNVLSETRAKLTKAEHDRDRYKAEIERLKAQQCEIDALKAENKELTKVVSSKVYDLIDNTKEIADAREAWEKQAKIEAVKDFAEKLKKYSYCDNDFMDGKWHRYVLVSDIDKLLKEYENGKQI